MGLIGQRGIVGNFGKAGTVQNLLGADLVSFILISNGEVFEVEGIERLIAGDRFDLNAEIAGLIPPIDGFKIVYNDQRDNCGVNALGQVGGKPFASVFLIEIDLVKLLEVYGYVCGIIVGAGGKHGKRIVTGALVHGEELAGQFENALGKICKIQLANVLGGREGAVAAIEIGKRFFGKFGDQAFRDQREDALFGFALGHVIGIKQMHEEVAEATIRAFQMFLGVVKAVLVELGGRFFGIELGHEIPVQPVGRVFDHRPDGIVPLVFGQNLLGGNVLEESAEAGNASCRFNELLRVFVLVNHFRNLFQSPEQIGSQFFGNLVDNRGNGGKIVAAEML